LDFQGIAIRSFLFFLSILLWKKKAKDIVKIGKEYKEVRKSGDF
jgi:hypothetical protein